MMQAPSTTAAIQWQIYNLTTVSRTFHSKTVQNYYHKLTSNSKRGLIAVQKCTKHLQNDTWKYSTDTHKNRCGAWELYTSAWMENWMENNRTKSPIHSKRFQIPNCLFFPIYMECQPQGITTDQNTGIWQRHATIKPFCLTNTCVPANSN